MQERTYSRPEFDPYGDAAVVTGRWALVVTPDDDSREAWYVIFATIPIVIVGVLLEEQIEGVFRSTWVVTFQLIFIAILVVHTGLVLASGMSLDWIGRLVETAGLVGVVGPRGAEEEHPDDVERDPLGRVAGLPEEGVYSWATDGYEQVSGARRQFPDESQRIVTIEDDRSWLVHHYFSEEREIWSEFSIRQDGAYLNMQRNKAKFGPVTNDSTITFSPPMQVALAEPKEGATWNGSWKGKTSGSYSSRIIDHGTMSIGGESLEVWGYEVRMQMRGELNGTVHAQIMFSPKYALTVKEHYRQDIQTDRGRYQAEWDMTLKSTTPQT